MAEWEHHLEAGGQGCCVDVPQEEPGSLPGTDDGGPYITAGGLGL